MTLYTPQTRPISTVSENNCIENHCVRQQYTIQFKKKKIWLLFQKNQSNT